MEYDKVGNASGVGLRESRLAGTYRIDGSILIIDWSHSEELIQLSYRIEGDSLTFESAKSPATHRYRRVPDDS